jgi:hypothetical protein
MLQAPSPDHAHKTLSVIKPKNIINTAGQFPALVVDEKGRAIRSVPLYLVNARSAIRMIFNDQAYVIKNYPGVYFRTGIGSHYGELYQDKQRNIPGFEPVPSIISYKGSSEELYDVEQNAPAFSKYLLLVRDGYRCQYCGNDDINMLTFDHVVPRCQGGVTSWENALTACFTCNQKKGGRTPEQANMRLLREPFTPTRQQLFDAVMTPNNPYVHHSWREPIQLAMVA